ncbi:fumarylacetoacetate hydrolase family protein [Alloalcanivorax xenomutans]|jgi:5-oxopent-3-ene-1,2,5-tricarboxylate decarboxylase / 2-hydroxyhepta-2,4-diene-1,7-dioate isomerase|uniref:fumarylacetoacetate hydrolase family protein n=1 Tax=Alloalcanivorax xenomutans TaxID=1094342 RepID=UPI0003B92124|nr:fumarylacetoacetate hydrolase family protein [Alloalcanivorax xenomutans]ERS13274.1 4-hydroxyphenylacetate isomerase [Alcanivorax sp. PN-3]WOA30355.1 fumarylacetoacetate hydrolase family protein [Alloalcanivorax xenomutans]
MRHAKVEYQGRVRTVTIGPDDLPISDDGAVLDVTALRWLPASGGTLFGVALNYRSLLEARLPEFHQPPYQKPPEKPVLFIKTPNTRNAHQGTVARPQGERLQPGPALGVVIGRRASRVSEQDALDYVRGYTVVNEFSLPEDSYYRPAIKAKCRDGFCALGPWWVDRDDIANPHDLTLTLTVNGVEKQRGSTADLIRPIPRLIAELSEFMTLNEGDVLITGTPPGRVDVSEGDQVDTTIESIGTLRNLIVTDHGGEAKQ